MGNKYHYDPDWRQWGGAVHTAQNQRLLYWPMLKSGDFDAILPVELETASIYGELKAVIKSTKNLDRKEMRKHNIDIILASAAIQADSILIGMDTIYQDIAKLHPDFHFENWTVIDQ